MTRRLWLVCLAVWFGLYAVFTLFDVHMKAQDVVMGGLAAAVCVLALLDK